MGIMPLTGAWKNWVWLTLEWFAGGGLECLLRDKVWPLHTSLLEAELADLTLSARWMQVYC